MQVHFDYTRDDWVLINEQTYRNWLYGLKPLTGSDFGICCFLLAFSVLGGLGLLVFLGLAVWWGLAWYFIVGALVLLVFMFGMAMEVVRPRRELVRGLFDELIFRMHLEATFLENHRRRTERLLRRQEQDGQLELGHRYCVHIDLRGYTLTTDFPPSWDGSVRQENRTEWSGVASIDLSDRALTFANNDGTFLLIPRSAFADDDGCRRFAEAALAYHASDASTSADTSAIQVSRWQVVGQK